VDNLIIQETETTPKIAFDKTTGTFIIEGKSLTDDAKLFYKPVAEWMTAYSKEPASKTELTIRFEYLNTSSSRQLLDLFKIMEGIPGAKVIWNFSDEDEDMEEMGHELAELVTVKFDFRSS
jgi:hypothetical protein